MAAADDSAALTAASWVAASHPQDHPTSAAVRPLRAAADPHPAVATSTASPQLPTVSPVGKPGQTISTLKVLFDAVIKDPAKSGEKPAEGNS